MSVLTIKQEQDLVSKVNRIYQPGDKIIITQDKAFPKEWTLAEPAQMYGVVAVVYCRETRCRILATRVQFAKP